FSRIASSLIPRASSYTENTSCWCSRSHRATCGPVHSSTRKRMHRLPERKETRTFKSPLGEEKTGANVVHCEPLVFAEDLVFACPMSEQADDVLYSQARPTNHGLPDHHGRVSRNPLEQFMVFHV